LRVGVTVRAGSHGVVVKTGHSVEHSSTDGTPILVNWHVPNLLKILQPKV
jgi:hypothetical protein